jgi:hypothetical protein
VIRSNYNKGAELRTGMRNLDLNATNSLCDGREAGHQQVNRGAVVGSAYHG